ncbi:hypothetical protein GGI42DRAFT_341063 [Trichoderma sp. SZMC 28013]
MRQRVTQALLLLGISYIGTAAHTNDNAVTLTMAQVRARIDGYLDAVKNGTKEVNGVPPNTEPSACALACGWLDNELPGLVSFPDSQEYSLLAAGYWTTQQAETRPTCRFSPTSAVDVSTGLLGLRVAECQFAVKSGGHSIAAGTSSIDNGVVIHMGGINQITLSEDESQLSVGTGNRWVNVYSFLDGTGLAVIGGRVAGVGVGGFTLGGGVSYFSGKHGWSCDNVMAYELFFALRGGGNNFGIITRIDFITYPQGDFFVGARTFEYDSATEAALNEALVNLNINGATDPQGGGGSVLTYAYDQPNDRWIIAAALYYGAPEENPAIMSNFTSVPHAFLDTLRVTSLLDAAAEFNASNPSGFRRTTWGLMLKNDANIVKEITAIFMNEYNSIKDVADLNAALIYQTVTLPTIAHFRDRGGNALGITEEDGPLILIEIDVAWSSESDDDRAKAASRNTINLGTALAKEKGVHHPFIFLNYADREQVVFPTYGEKSFSKLVAASEKYDPDQVWQTFQPQIFRLNPAHAV